MAIEYLHYHKIVYRDLKPENVMITHDGYVRLIDMGTAKFIDSKPARTYTIIGTPHYMAPEVLLNKGYSFYVDIWSIGIILYEFMCGLVPFGETCEDPFAIYQEIVTSESPDFPEYMNDKLAKKLIHQLLLKTPEARLGGDFSVLKANKWFEESSDEFCWDSLANQKVKAVPYTPPSAKYEDYDKI